MGIHKFIQKVCVQTAVYWGAPVADGYGGMTYGEPIELSPPTNGVRWRERVEVITDAAGNEIVSKAGILTPSDLDEQGVLWLGALNALTEAQKTDPRLVVGAYTIKRFDRTPLFRSTDKFVRMAYL